jgi:hypothetical protein
MIRPIPWVTDVEESMILQRRQQQKQVYYVRLGISCQPISSEPPCVDDIPCHLQQGVSIFTGISAHLYTGLGAYLRNATDQSGLIPAEGMAFVIKKPSNHSYKYLIATIRPTTVGRWSGHL